MSVKGRDLSYEAQEPAFLRRLRAQQAGRGDPDRHERPIARPTRAKEVKADEDDAPTYVDEESNRTLSKEEYEALLSGKDQKTEGKDATGSDEASDARADSKEDDTEASAEAARHVAPKQDVTQVGKAQKKRKAAKVVGGDGEAPAEDAKTAKLTVKKPKKKAKAVALSFDEEG